MLVRFVVENVLSFGERKEFSLLANNRLKTLDHHKYDSRGVELLKLSSIYGANGAGKSNLIKAISLLKDMVVHNSSVSLMEDARFKFSDPHNSRQVLAIEFIQDEQPFLFAVSVKNSFIETEELYLSGMGKDDQLIYERKTSPDGSSTIMFSEELEKDERIQILKSVLVEDFVKPDKLILQFLSRRGNEAFTDIKIAYKWFSEVLTIIRPYTELNDLTTQIDNDKDLRRYAKEVIVSLHIGITTLKVESRDAKEYFGEENEPTIMELIKKMQMSDDTAFVIQRPDGGRIVLEESDGKYRVKFLQLEHKGKHNKTAYFATIEESDGTQRLLDFMPMFNFLSKRKKVYMVDEIDRSIHPLLIKELLRQFSYDKDSKGQLIFTTHESNLLDQELFRQDEIWFAEKNNDGETDLYSLNDFKEHKTIDIQKGYLNGRYGSIPFLADLKNLQWDKHDTE